VLPSQNLATNVSFLMDTGADQTVLMPADATKMGLSFAELKNGSVSLGVGGYAKDFIEPANVIFLGSSGKLYIYQIQLRISESAPAIMDVPSLLGRNIIDSWRIRYSPTEKVLECDALSADHIVAPQV